MPSSALPCASAFPLLKYRCADDERAIQQSVVEGNLTLFECTPAFLHMAYNLTTSVMQQPSDK